MIAATLQRLVLTTAPSEAGAAAMARQLLDRRLAACVQIIAGVRSLYRWEGKICDDGEWLLLIKTTAPRLEELERTILELHEYEVPELVVLPIDAGGRAYLDWLDAQTR